MTEQLVEIIENVGLIFFLIVMVVLGVFVIIAAILCVIWIFKNWNSILKGVNEHDGE